MDSTPTSSSKLESVTGVSGVAVKTLTFSIAATAPGPVAGLPPPLQELVEKLVYT